MERALAAVLGALESLAFVARHFDPEDFPDLLAAIGTPEASLPAGVPDSPELAAAAAEAAAGFAALRAAGDIRDVFRALRHLPRAQEALYPLAATLGPVDRYFLAPGARGATASPPPEIRLDAARGGYSLALPADDDASARPLVMALHGGSGNGRAFLWSWLRDARLAGAVLVAPTATGPTWALAGEDPDTPTLARIIDEVARLRPVDPARLLLTGLSDGGTFCYASGLAPGSPFTHLAPVAASFHPFIAAMADRDRIRGLPIHITHGARDWMFPVEMARSAARSLAAAGAAVRYREIDDLAHAYPPEINPDLLAWLAGT